MTTALEYLERIERHYEKCKAKKISRFNPDWCTSTKEEQGEGAWVREMNVEIRRRIKAEDPESLLLKYVFMFWISRSRLLEMHHTKKFFGKVKRVRERRYGDRLKQIILSGKPPKIEKTFEEIAKTLVN